MSKQGRIEVIDSFRGIAILSVLAFHYLVRWATPYNSTDLTGYQHVFLPIFVIGRYGVNLFFIISGLVITMTVLRVQSAGEFCMHRLARLYPAFLVGVCITFAITQFGPQELKTTPTDFLGNLTMVPSLINVREVDGSYWSLVVELKFYALVALAFALLKERFWLIVLGIAILSGVAKATGHGASLLMSTFWPYFVFGMGTWYWFREKKHLPAIALGATGIVLYAMNAPSGFAANAYIVTGSAALLSLLALNRPTFADLLAPVGRISYSLYLVHQFIGVTIIHALKAVGTPDIFAIVVALAAVTCLAILMYRFVERPGQRFIRNLFEGLQLKQRQPVVPVG